MMHVRNNKPGAVSRRTLLGAAAGLVAGVGAVGSTVATPPPSTSLIEAALQGMTMRERISQLFVIQAWDVVMTQSYAELLATLKPGGVIFMGNNIGSYEQVSSYTRAIHESNRLFPPFIAVDQEGGPVTRVPGDPVPGAMEMGYYTDAEVRQFGAARGEFLRGFGFDVNLAPVADIAYAANSFMAYRSFGHDPDAVASKVNAIVGGLQSTSIACAAKHFPGHGRTTTDSHYATPMIDLSLDEWLITDAIPFQAASKAGVDMMMVGHIWNPQWDDVPTSLSRTALTNLRRKTGFMGPVISDDLVMGALWMYSPYEIVERAINAGIDLLLYSAPPVPFLDLVEHIAARVEDGTITEKRINANARRVLRFKAHHFKLWTTTGPYPTPE